MDAIPQQENFDNYDEVIKYQIKKFDIKKMKPDRIAVLVGKRGSGKSVLMEEILQNLSKEFDVVIGMSPTQSTRDTFAKHIPECLIYDNLNLTLLENIVAQQRENAKKGIYKRIGLVFDDCLYDKKQFREKVIRDIFMNGRHYKLFVLICAQYLMDLEISLRSNVDYLFTCKETSTNNKKRLYNDFFSAFSTPHSFEAALEDCTNNYAVMVLDNSNSESSVEKSVFWYRATLGEKNFLLGNRNMWKMAYSLSLPEEESSSFSASLIPAFAKNKKAGVVTETESQVNIKKKRKKNGGSLTIIEKKDVNGDDLDTTTTTASKKTPSVLIEKAPSSASPEAPKRREKATVNWDNRRLALPASSKKATTNTTSRKKIPVNIPLNVGQSHQNAYVEDYNSIMNGKSIMSATNSMNAAAVLFRK